LATIKNDSTTLSALERDELVRNYLPLVRHVVSRIAAGLPAHVDSEELFQVGSVGLMNASRGFDPTRGVSFKTYAFALIRGSVMDELRRLDSVPRSTREKIRAIDRCTSRLRQVLGRAPTVPEISVDLEMPEATVDYALRAARNSVSLSLDDGAGAPEALIVRDLLACPNTQDPGDAAAKSEMIGCVADRILSLPEADRRVVTMYYREGLLLREIGVILGVTESRVSQIHSRALTRLQQMLK